MSAGKAVTLLVKVLGGSGLFVGAGASWLAVQGRLDSETLSHLPGLGSLRHEAPADGHGDDAGTDPAAGEKAPPTAGSGHEVSPAGAEGARPAPDHAAAGGGAAAANLPSLPAPVLPEPFSSTEVNEMLREAGKARAEYESRGALLDERERELRRAERDLDERRREIETLMQRFSELEQALASDRKKFERDVVRVQAAEQGNVKKLASLYEGMPDAAAASALGQVDVATAAKVLSAMQKRKAGKVLGAMPAALAAEVSDKMTRILDDTRTEGGEAAPSGGGTKPAAAEAAPPKSAEPASPDAPAEK